MNINRQKKYLRIVFQVFAAMLCVVQVLAQQHYDHSNITLIKTIQLKDITGEITGISVNLNAHLAYIVGEVYSSQDVSNNTIELLNLDSGKLMPLLNTISDPQHICYLPQHDELFISTSGSKCFFYDAGDLKKIASVKLTSSANSLFYDSIERIIYVSYGEDELAIINVDSYKQTGFMLLPGQVEHMQLDKQNSRLYANMPAYSKTAFIDTKLFKLTENRKGKSILADQIALDTFNHRLFICTKKKPVLSIVDVLTEKQIDLAVNLKTIESLNYSPPSHTLYIGGRNSLNIFTESSNGFSQTDSLPLSGKVLLLIPELNLLIISKENKAPQKTDILIYKINN